MAVLLTILSIVLALGSLGAFVSGFVFYSALEVKNLNISLAVVAFGSLAILSVMSRIFAAGLN